MSRIFPNRGAGQQPREGRGSQHPGRFARTRRDPAPAPVPEPGTALDAEGLDVHVPSTEEILRRAAAAGIATADRPLGQVARDVALAEARRLVGVPDEALAAAAGPGPAPDRAIAAAAAGFRPEVAIVAALHAA